MIVSFYVFVKIDFQRFVKQQRKSKVNNVQYDFLNFL